MTKVYKTAKGKPVDIGVLIAKNEEIRAVGNMNVNARGDKIDSHNQPVKTRQQQVQKFYKQQVSKQTALEDTASQEKTKVTALVEDNIPVVEEPVEFPADVLADDEMEIVKDDAVVEAISSLEFVDSTEVKLSENVKEVIADQTKSKGLAGAIQKVKDSKKED
jgi:hypothetical protein